MPHVAPFPFAGVTTPRSPRPSPLVGVTMRLLRQENTGDVHDALSADWGRFLAAVGLRWLPLPNRREETLAMVQALDLGGIIFSGGGDVGKEPARDATEGLLLQWARRQNVPVLGVCRGFQALQWHLGGELTPVCGHVATRHALWRAEAGAISELEGTPSRGDASILAGISVFDAVPEAARATLERWMYRRTEVNSYHNMGIAQLAAPLVPLALGCDAAGMRHVEAAWAEGLLGLMWHPERESLPDMEDVALVREFFTV